MAILTISFVMDALYVEGAQVMSLSKLLMDGLLQSLREKLKAQAEKYQINFNPFTTRDSHREIEGICEGDIIILHLEVVKARGDGLPPQTKHFFLQLINHLRQLKGSSDDVPRVILIPAIMCRENVPSQVYQLIRNRECYEFASLFQLDWDKCDNFDRLAQKIIDLIPTS